MPRRHPRRFADLLHPEPLHSTAPDQPERGAEYPLLGGAVAARALSYAVAHGRGYRAHARSGEANTTVMVDILDIYRMFVSSTSRPGGQRRTPSVAVD